MHPSCRMNTWVAIYFLCLVYLTHIAAVNNPNGPQPLNGVGTYVCNSDYDNPANYQNPGQVDCDPWTFGSTSSKQVVGDNTYCTSNGFCSLDFYSANVGTNLYFYQNAQVMKNNVAVTYAFTMMPNTGFYLNSKCVNSQGVINYDLDYFAGNCQNSTYCNITNVQQPVYIRSAYDADSSFWTFVRTCSLDIDPMANQMAFIILAFTGSVSCNVRWKVEPFDLYNMEDYGPLTIKSKENCPLEPRNEYTIRNNDVETWVYVGVFAIGPFVCFFFFCLRGWILSKFASCREKKKTIPKMWKCDNVREVCTDACESCTRHKAQGGTLCHCYCSACHSRFDVHRDAEAGGGGGAGGVGALTHPTWDSQKDGGAKTAEKEKEKEKEKEPAFRFIDGKNSWKCINVAEVCICTCDLCFRSLQDSQKHCYCHRCHKKWDCHKELAGANSAVKATPLPSRNFIAISTDAEVDADGGDPNPMWGQRDSAPAAVAVSVTIAGANTGIPLAVAYAAVPASGNRGGYPEASAPIMAVGTYDPSDMD